MFPTHARDPYEQARNNYQVEHTVLRRIGRFTVVKPHVQTDGTPVFDVIVKNDRDLLPTVMRQLGPFGLVGQFGDLESAEAFAREEAAKDNERGRQREREERSRAVAAARKLVAAEDERLAKLAEARRLIAESDE